MTNFINARNAVLAFAFVGFAGLGISSFSGQASASILDQCRETSKTKVVACCKQYIERQGRPFWMGNGTANNCAAAAVCVGTKSSSPIIAVAYFKPKATCYLEIPNNQNQGTKANSTPKPTQQNSAAGKN